jgi:LydA holin phage, holin superfamily III
MSPEPFTSTIMSKHIFFGVMALFGGVVHALVKHRRGETKGVGDFIALSVISGFSGVMWLFIALTYFPENLYLIGFAAGMGGYMSTEGLTLIVIYFKERFAK